MEPMGWLLDPAHPGVRHPAPDLVAPHALEFLHPHWDALRAAKDGGKRTNSKA